MGRRKIEIKPIKDDRNRSVTFLKRKGGLFKKAHELSVLCSVEVAVIIFGSNKKLYQYSSGDITDIINRHAYFDSAHESKGPADFKDKNLQDDDDDDDIPERAGSHSSLDHPLPPHMHHAGVHMNTRHTASASPPNMPKNLIGPGQYAMGARVGTPQPSITRPSSRNQNHIQRRNSSNLAPPHSYSVTQPPPQTNGVYAYHMPHHPSAYNPQPQNVMPMQQPSQMHGYPSYPPQHPHTHQPPHPQQPQIQPPPQHQPPPPHPQHPQQHQTQAQAQAEAFINDTRRQSMPPTYTNEPAAEPEPPMSRPEQPSPPQNVEKRAPTKSRSMFTPIGPSDSVLAAHFGFGQQEQQPRSHSIDVGSITRKNADQSFSTPIKNEKPQAPPAINTSPQLPSRSNSMADPKSAGMRPKLKVHIPTEAEEEASPASSPRGGSSATAGNQSAIPANNESGPVVLPPPSPSVSALLSAGATGPSNPFSRPPPASQAPEQTPMSALPSRFTESILPSPSQFYGDGWSLPFPPRNGANDNMLPSPLNFQTPIGATQQNFFKDAIETNGNGKRRSPGPEQTDSSAAKRVKT